ncbi:MAG: Spo0B domain-containing protein [Peptococcaceae bacterium]|nr:Spo0B domain-containing protein [Peptococcaceae bacterium]
MFRRITGNACEREVSQLSLQKLLGFIQAQRHDFLNHLQVISGLLQLNKMDRAREYIRDVTMEIARLSKTARVGVPEVTVALLSGFYDASMCQVEMELTVDSRLAGSAVPGPVLGKALELSLDCAISAMALPDAKTRHLEMILTENEKNYICRLLFPETSVAVPGHFEKRLAPVGDLLEPYGGRVNLAMANSGVEIFLTFPRKDLQSG